MEINKRQRKRYIFKATAIIMLFVVTIFFCMTLFVKADNDAPSDYSFYTLTSIASSALSSCAASPESDSLQTHFGNGLNASSAGGVLGYTDTSKDTGIIGFLSSVVSGSTVTYDYRQMCSGDYASHAGTTNFVFSPYLALGAVLADMGIDKTGTEVSGTMGRKIIGGVVFVSYIIAQCVNAIFAFVIKIMKMVNPFQFFSDANLYTTTTVDHTSLKQPGFFSDLLSGATTFISRIYGEMYNLGTVVITLCFAIMIVGIIMGNLVLKSHTSKFGMIRNFLIRASFIIFGIPLLGGTYTALLDSFDATLDEGNTAAAKVVASTFCDFEGWVMSENHSLRLPVPVKVQVRKGHIIRYEDDASATVQDYCYGINQMVANTGLPTNMVTTSGKDNVLKIIEDVQNTGVHDVEPSDDLYSWVSDMLIRYMTGKKIYASSYEQTWIASTWNNSTICNKEKLQKAIDKIDSVDDIQSNGSISDIWSNDNFDAVGYQTVPNPFGAPDPGVSGFNMASEYVLVHTLSANLPLSPMSIYNYLNTTFDETSAKVFSSEKTSSMLVRDYHYSVNVVGKGISSVLSLALCVTLLLTYGILGLVYGLGIIITNIKRGLRLIISVPGAMLGSVQSIAKVITYTVLLILELIINFMLYGVSTELLYNLTYVVTKEFRSVANSVFGSLAGVTLTPIMSLFTIIFLIWFCIECIKLRKPVTKALEEMGDNVVRHFILGNNGGGPGAPGAPSGGPNGGGPNGGAPVAAGAERAAMEPKKKRTFVGRGIEKMQDTSKEEVLIGEMFGGNGGSAFAEEQAFDKNKRAKRDAKKMERREKMQAGKQAVVGAAKIAVASQTGNTALAADGIKDLGKSASMANQAAENRYQAELAANTQLATTLNPNMAKHDQRLGYTKGQAKPVEHYGMGSLAKDVKQGAAAYTLEHDLKGAYQAAGKDGVKAVLNGGSVNAEQTVTRNVTTNVKDSVTKSGKLSYGFSPEVSPEANAVSMPHKTLHAEAEMSRKVTDTVETETNVNQTVSVNQSYGGQKFRDALNTVTDSGTTQTRYVNDNVQTVHNTNNKDSGNNVNNTSAPKGTTRHEDVVNTVYRNVRTQHVVINNGSNVPFDGDRTEQGDDIIVTTEHNVKHNNVTKNDTHNSDK